jgi:hypothetical protein
LLSHNLYKSFHTLPELPVWARALVLIPLIGPSGFDLFAQILFTEMNGNLYGGIDQRKEEVSVRRGEKNSDKGVAEYERGYSVRNCGGIQK